MRSLMILAAAAVLTAIFGFNHPSNAADVKDVLDACDSMANANPGSCGYSVNDKNGDITGCVVGKGPCFYCANDGKRQCIQVRQVTGGSVMPVAGADHLLSNIRSAKIDKTKLNATAPVMQAPAAVAPQ